MCSSLSFDKPTNQGLEYFYHLQKFLLKHPRQFPTTSHSPPSNHWSHFCNFTLNLSVPECHRMGSYNIWLSTFAQYNCFWSLCSFLWLRSIPWDEYFMIGLSIHLMITLFGFWPQFSFSTLVILWMKLLWTFICKFVCCWFFFFLDVFSFHLRKHARVTLLCYM